MGVISASQQMRAWDVEFSQEAVTETAWSQKK
jgi:hypothetical protein